MNLKSFFGVNRVINRFRKLIEIFAKLQNYERENSLKLSNLKFNQNDRFEKKFRNIDINHELGLINQ